MSFALFAESGREDPLPRSDHPDNLENLENLIIRRQRQLYLAAGRGAPAESGLEPLEAEAIHGENRLRGGGQGDDLQ